MADHSAAGHHGSPDDEYAFTPEGASYEHTDAAIGPVAKFLFWLFIAAVLTHFGLESRRDLPGIDDLKAAGLLDPLDESIFQLQLESEDEAD